LAELIGQEAMVRTLGNAIKRDRIAHAFPAHRGARRRQDLDRAA
jgi:O6-methylguanine-DNA--protein-cysteine methyltransferase